MVSIEVVGVLHGRWWLPVRTGCSIGRGMDRIVFLYNDEEIRDMSAWLRYSGSHLAPLLLL